MTKFDKRIAYADGALVDLDEPIHSSEMMEITGEYTINELKYKLKERCDNFIHILEEVGGPIKDCDFLKGPELKAEKAIGLTFDEIEQSSKKYIMCSRRVEFV